MTAILKLFGVAALIAANAFSTFRKLASPTWLTSMPNRVCVLTFLIGNMYAHS